MNVFSNDSKTDLKLRCDNCMNSRNLGLQKFEVDWQLCFSCYYPTTPTDYPSTTSLWAPPVAVNIDFCDISDFWAFGFSELYGYSMPLTTFLVKKEFLFHRPGLIFQPTMNSRASDNQSTRHQKRIRSSGRNAQYKVYIHRCLWTGVGGEGVQFVSCTKA